LRNPDVSRSVGCYATLICRGYDSRVIASFPKGNMLSTVAARKPDEKRRGLPRRHVPFGQSFQTDCQPDDKQRYECASARAVPQRNKTACQAPPYMRENSSNTGIGCASITGLAGGQRTL
jgi:hypothetical protein